MHRLFATFAIAMAGCLAPNPVDEPAGVTSFTPVALTEIQKRADELLRLPIDSERSIPESGCSDCERHLVMTLESFAADGCQTTLCVSRETDTAWLLIAGGIGDHVRDTIGPWPASAPEVQRLIDAISDKGVDPTVPVLERY